MDRIIFCVLVITGLLNPTTASAQRRADQFASTKPLTIDQLKEAFNQDKGTPRLILLLSPT